LNQRKISVGTTITGTTIAIGRALRKSLEENQESHEKGENS
jgi:hypothetical protein